MRKFLLVILCACGTPSFAQTGFFIQPELGIGISNTNWQYLSPGSNTGQKNIFSDEFVIKAGYQNDRWELTTGIGYLNTGYKINTYNGFVPGVLQEYSVPHAWPVPDLYGKYSMHDPHIIMPFEVGYKIHLNSKLVFTPSVGVTAMYNLQRHIVTNVPLSSYKEPSQDFETYCNQYSLSGTAQFSFEYALTKKIVLVAGPSAQYMLTPEMKKTLFGFYAPQYDYAFLMNIGLKYCFSKKHSTKAAATEELKSAK